MEDKNFQDVLNSICTFGILVFAGWLIWTAVSTVVQFIFSIIWAILLFGGVSGFMIVWYSIYSKKNNLPTKNALLKLDFMVKQQDTISDDDKVIILKFLNHCEGLLGDNEKMMVIIKDLQKRCSREIIIDEQNTFRRDD